MLDPLSGVEPRNPRDSENRKLPKEYFRFIPVYTGICSAEPSDSLASLTGLAPASSSAKGLQYDSQYNPRELQHSSGSRLSVRRQRGLASPSDLGHMQLSFVAELHNLSHQCSSIPVPDCHFGYALVQIWRRRARTSTSVYRERGLETAKEDWRRLTANPARASAQRGEKRDERRPWPWVSHKPSPARSLRRGHGNCAELGDGEMRGGRCAHMLPDSSEHSTKRSDGQGRVERCVRTRAQVEARTLQPWQKPQKEQKLVGEVAAESIGPMRETDAGMEGTFKVQSRVAARQGELSLLAAQKHRVKPYTCRLAMTATPQLP
ncbi:hypothetical protein C8Q70DRAFT_937419 [Cubamyces menziesii]|nr:hypothetical protein C8Q70DRAFT_937419 [Cubamyces menziesii]